MILNKGLKRYRDEIPNHYYKKYQKLIADTRGKSWYGEKITLDAATMIFCGRDLKNDCNAYNLDIKSRRDNGEDISKADYVKGLEATAEKYLPKARGIVNKSAPLLNPSFEGFLGKCSKLYHQSTQELLPPGLKQ
jgi:hypothetical protein